MSESLRGRLIVATPSLPDPNFDHSVVLLLDHDEEGAIGVVVNRPSELTIAESLPEWERLAAEPSVVFVGGPVEQGALIGLALLGSGADPTWHRVSGRIGVLDLARDPEEVSIDVQLVRVFAGYSGWAPGQLEAEVDAGAWFVLDAEPEDAFADGPEELWRGVLERQGGLFRTFPADPSMN